MTPALGILCYHRIVEANDDRSWPYLERGTAVRAQTFESHLADIAQFADIVSEEVALDILAQRRRLERPSVWLTFDDGYRDVKQALPQVETGTVFVTTSASERLLPADAWYAVLLAAGRVRGTLDLGLGPFEFDLAEGAGRARLVNGPERHAYLRATGAAQQVTLQELARQLDTHVATISPYLDESELRALIHTGWSVGSHGVTHTPFDAIDSGEVQREAAVSRETLRALGAPVRSIALPDGARAHVDVLKRLGYECVLGLGDATCAFGVETQPRFLVPNDPGWVIHVLKPALTGGTHG